MKATESFCTSLVLQMCSRVILVTQTWGYKEQQMVENYIEQLNSVKDQSLHISPTHKMIVIHNRVDAIDLEDLKSCVGVL